MIKKFLLSLVLVTTLILSACTVVSHSTPTPVPTPTTKTLNIGMILVGPYNDGGWSQANFEGTQYAVSKIPGTKFSYIDNSYNLKTSPEQQAESMVSQGANVIIYNSDAFMDDSNTFASKYPNIPVIMLSGDQNWKEGQNYKNIPNMINIMGKSEVMEEITGCSAALTTKTGKIGYLGPLINQETRRISSSAFLGAEYCWTKILNKPASDLTFKVVWIGNWFNIPGSTLDPTQVADDFYNSGMDVVISGIDTTEAMSEAHKMTASGKTVYAVPYDYENACDQFPEVCLSVSFYKWGPSILQNLLAIQNNTWKPHFEWNGPDWNNITGPDSGGTGYKVGQGLIADNPVILNKFVQQLKDGLVLWKGELRLQDGSVYLKDGEVATDVMIWYLPQLLQGMQGPSK